MESRLARWTRPEHLGWLAGLLLAGGGSAPAPTCTPTGAEVCDGVDNDCNGWWTTATRAAGPPATPASWASARPGPSTAPAAA